MEEVLEIVKVKKDFFSSPPRNYTVNVKDNGH